MNTSYNSLQRVLTTLSHKEPDKVPLFLLFSHYGAKELGIGIQDYFSNSENVVEAQLRLTEKFNNDCLFSFSYASAELEAFGGTTFFPKEGSPNSGIPVIKKASDIENLKVPNILETKSLTTILETIKKLKREAADTKPIISVALSPFSLPVMQLGFDKYIELIYKEPVLFDKLMAVNQEFCITWANAQIEAGATAICYFDPVSSSSVLPRNLYLQKGFPVAKHTISKINAPVATHFASGKINGIINDLPQTSTILIGISSSEDIGEMKEKVKGQLSLIGNLNGIEMCRWTDQEAENQVKSIIKKAAKGGGLIISDNHGEIPYQVPERVLYKISETVQKYGKYPIDWF